MIWATCTTCGKRSYMTRHEARQARKLTGGKATGMNVYQCGGSGYYHIGHLPKAVRRGHATRGEIYRDREVG